MSINKVIKTADIPRGSFYQYFDDKVDLVEVVFKSLMDMALGEAFRAVSVSNGDVFYVYSKRRLGKWKDAGVRIEGVGVTSLTHTFLSDFVFAGGECDSFSKYYKYRKKKSSGYSEQFMQNSSAYLFWKCQ